MMAAAADTKGNFPGERYTVESHTPDPQASTEGLVTEVPDEEDSADKS